MIHSLEELEQFRQLYKQCVTLMAEKRQKTLKQQSPYSQKINCYISSAKELQLYQELQLKETVITRPSLVLNIDPTYRTVDGICNLDRMLMGKAPYDALTGSTIDVHHIGQLYHSPFAEIPHCVHNAAGTYSILHQTVTISWRNDPALLQQTAAEIILYWKRRGNELYEKLHER